MKNLSKLLAVALVVFSFQACTEVLEDVEPTTAITPEVAFSDAGSVRAFRTQLYSRLHSFTYTTQYMIGPEALGDQSYNRTGSSRFNAYSTFQFGAGMNHYTAAYNLIQDANVVIGAIPDGVIPAAEKSQYQGEAYFFRAFAMHHLVRALGYEPGNSPSSGDGAGWDLGIIIRTEPVLGLTQADARPRNTVAEVYSQIRSDLGEAITLLGQNQESSRNYVQQAAAYALLARVELYARNWQAAANNAASALSNTSAALATGADVVTMFDETVFSTHPEAIFEVEVNPNTEGQGINSSLNVYSSEQWVAQIPTNSLLALYDQANDQRWNWFTPCFSQQENAPVSGCTNNGGLMITKWFGEKGQFTDDIPHFRVAEMLLIQAEAYLNGATGGTAAGALNTLRAARGVADIAAPTIDDILDERRRELAFEGQRFFDLKRLGRSITKDPEVLGSAVTIQYTDVRFLDDIDPDDLDDNPELVQNPGYN
ncbi:RagB/SusD family nutrient uptake outer membrane protein [Balneola sp. MJW-20]|uniref:RagB/SusD family nutrient uptake outer membrane protein n=1 Tax=Gracilimonas aurantiaca TaxID=3234185 RepID=UPI003464F28F